MTTAQVATVSVATDTTQVAVAATPKSVAQRAARLRYSFGPTWNQAVVAGKATDQDKLLAQAIKLKVGAPFDLKKLKLVTLRTKVAAKLEADLLAEFDAVEVPASTGAEDAVSVETPATEVSAV